MDAAPRTRWTLVAIVLAAGIVAACQIGKAAIAVPLLRQDLGASLVQASWIVGAYGTLGAIAGLPAGVVVSIVGSRAAVVAGFSAIATGSLLGALAENGALLLATRLIESCGFIAAVIGLATLLRSATSERDRAMVFAVWGSYLPAGSAVMMLAGPFVASWGWQTLWLLNGALAALCALVLWVAAPHDARAPPTSAARLLASIGDVLRMPGPLMLAGVFFLYTVQYFALTGLLPTLLVERMGLSIAAAGGIAALTVVAKASGNLAAGILVRLGAPLWATTVAAFVCLGIASLGIFADWMPLALVAALASLSLAVTGLVPASIFAAAPRIATAPAVLAITLGLIVQASNLGQLLGPAVLAAWVERFGWPAAPALFITIAAAAIALALRLRRRLKE
jgi:MFS family permease